MLESKTALSPCCKRAATSMMMLKFDTIRCRLICIVWGNVRKTESKVLQHTIVYIFLCPVRRIRRGQFFAKERQRKKSVCLFTHLYVEQLPQYDLRGSVRVYTTRLVLKRQQNVVSRYVPKCEHFRRVR